MSRKKTQSKTRRRSSSNRNRKLKAEARPLPTRSVLVCSSIVCMALAYLWLSSRTEALAQQIKVEENALTDLRRDVAAEEVRWNDMIGPRNLKLALKENNLNMDWPKPEQVLHIRDMALWESGRGNLNHYSSVDDRERGRH